MQRMTIKEWAEKVETNATGMQAEHYRIYVIRNGETIFYIGQSHNPHNRLLEHMALSWTQPSLIGTFIRENAPAFGAWFFEQYTLEDCSKVVGRCHDADDAEEALIKLHRPYFNAAMNPHPLPLPMRYKSSERDFREAKNAHAGDLSELFNFK